MSDPTPAELDRRLREIREEQRTGFRDLNARIDYLAEGRVANALAIGKLQSSIDAIKEDREEDQAAIARNRNLSITTALGIAAILVASIGIIVQAVIG